MSSSRTFTLTFTGDVMLGRLVDQLWSQHVDNARDHHVKSTFIKHYPHLASYTHQDPWGNTLQLFHDSDLNLINLETAVTTCNAKWPNKAFNYRMHPTNAIGALAAAGIDYVSLANNHTLDFGVDGLVETIRTMREAKVQFAGAGETVDESRRPAVLSLPSQKKMEHKKEKGNHKPDLEEEEEEEEREEQGGGGGDDYQVHVYSATDHPRDWASVPTLHLINYTAESRHCLKQVLTAAAAATTATTLPPPLTPVQAKNLSRKSRCSQPALKIFSVHWGPNYAWQPAAEIRDLAHFLIDECGVDIVHGHSSHHIQGVERYKSKLIIYGCGDFVDDYATHEEYRNDLGAVWRVVASEQRTGLLKLEKLEISPLRISQFSAVLLDPADRDHDWVKKKLTELSMALGTAVRNELGSDGQVIIDLAE